LRMRALALLSGGLDSILAARLLLDQELEVAGVGFSSPFFSPEAAGRSARNLGIEFFEFDITDPLLEAIRNPPHGLGRNLNPCADCHAIMVAEAFARIPELGGDFVATGEVLGQRPKSQTRAMMNVVARAGKPGLLLRPLCARILPPTIPEERGWVDREKLLDISGRSRKRQFELARRYGIRQYATPSGGCLLTEAEFCRRLSELEKFEGWERDSLDLLRVGRHFRLPSGAKAVSGRERKENRRLEKLAGSGDILLETPDRQRSLILLRGSGGNPEDLRAAAGICARYSKGSEGQELEISWRRAGEETPPKTISVLTPAEEELEKMRI